ncbi:MAG: DUF192 domain-containing protein [Rhodospirillales bacterium]|nr:DUF192 domain-containing protein [Rhodospirillales bacterium]
MAIVTQDGVTHPFRVEIARTREELMQGLMNRLEMPEDAGMLFIFARENPRSFWMKGTFIPLDMVFIRADGTIHHIHHNAVPHDQTGIPSEGPVLAVLEINGGVAEKLGLKPGNKVLYKTFGTAPLQVE